MYRGRFRKIHFIGIGGSGMNGIAEVLLNMGYEVSGSDISSTDATERLGRLGAVIFHGHAKANVRGSDCVVYSSAVKKSNPEFEEAVSLHIPVIPRAEMLAELMRMKYGVAVAGMHGKTTATSMAASVLALGGIDPTIVIGGRLNSLGANARLGAGEYLIAEADESDGSFLKLTPVIAVVTNIDREHMDHYKDMDEIISTFLSFMNKVPFYGSVVVCLDDPILQGLLPCITRRLITYGFSAQSDLNARAVWQEGSRTSFDVFSANTPLGRVAINMPGRHNVLNALAAIAVARELDIDFSAIKAGLEGFAGVERRFQIRGREKDIMIVDDYGHHPVEIRAVIKAAKEGWKTSRTIVVFQPHRYTRTKDLFTEFLSAFNDAEKLVLTDIYPAGEAPIDGITGERLFCEIKNHGHKDVVFVPYVKDVALYLKEIVKPGDMVITMGAGDVWKAGVRLLSTLAQ
ncbi:MAG: UDP-N-acetylmuramate--L-alanine ligase [Deltaproteobacteria bacterium]|nr:UDP-N-acetylmuramate--L-alanine ligase [Deltaproteobacteria bacterium]